MKFSLGLMATRLKKIARIGTPDGRREEQSARVAAELRQDLNLPITYRNFTNRAEAMEWLLQTAPA